MPKKGKGNASGGYRELCDCTVRTREPNAAVALLELYKQRCRSQGTTHDPERCFTDGRTLHLGGVEPAYVGKITEGRRYVKEVEITNLRKIPR